MVASSTRLAIAARKVLIHTVWAKSGHERFDYVTGFSRTAPKPVKKALGCFAFKEKNKPQVSQRYKVICLSTYRDF